MAHTAQERYSSMVLQRMYASQVTKDNVIFNTRYEGSPKAGAVKIPTRANVSVSDYDKANGLALAGGSTSYITMEINKDKAVNELIDGFDAASVPDGIVADRLTSAGKMLGEQLDKDGLAELATNGTVVAKQAAFTKSTIYDAIVDARTALGEANISTMGRYIIVTPTVFGLLLKNSDFIKASDLGQEILKTGAIGQIAGFNVFESNNMGTGVDFIAGHPDCATRANEWGVPVKVQDLDGSGTYIGACAVQGRLVYAHKVTHQAGIIVSTFTAG